MQIFEYQASLLPRITYSGRQDSREKPWRNIRRTTGEHILYFCIRRLSISNIKADGLYRDENIGSVETFEVCKGAKIHTLSPSNILHQNRVGKPLPLLLNEGEIDRLYMYNVDAGEDEKLVNRGTIGKITEI